MSKYRENPNLRPREYRHEPTRPGDRYPKWLESFLKNESSLTRLLRKKKRKGAFLMYREMEKFRKRATAIDQQIEDLKAKQLEAQQELAAVTQEHDGMIIREATEGVTCDEKQLQRLKKKMQELQEKIEDYQHRISVIEAKRKDVLAELFEDLEKGYVRELESLQREASAQFNDAIKLGFEYLLALQRVGKLKERASKLHAEFLNEGRKAVDGLERKISLWPLMDKYNAVPICRSL
ncbi:hypothetical protein LR69_01255 [Geobacillus sp. BCO2]|nr:hypothetical protein LR69_01255 [Geobacillus sp. BCO2]